MKVEQAYYTSCQAGLRGAMGFQFNAASEGIGAATFPLLERLGLYAAPLSAPSRPTAEELARFPVALLYQKLPDGSAVAACARYVGQDYSGRFGNYFTHFLLVPASEPGFESVLPVELWCARIWTTAESASRTLPSLGDLPAGGVITPESVAEFLAQDGRMARLPALVTAVEQALAAGRRVIIVDADASVATWVAVAAYALPRPMALALTFNTYTRTPYQSDALVVGTTPDADFRFAPYEIEHQFSVFDFAQNRFSPCPAPSPFAAIVAAAYAHGQAESVARFPGFVARVDPATPPADLAVAFASFALAAKLGLPGVPLEGVTEWCSSHVASLGPEELDAVFAVVGEDGPDALVRGTAIFRATLRDESVSRRHAGVQRRYLERLVRAAASPAEVPTLRAALAQEFPAGAAGVARTFRTAWLQLATPGLDAQRAGALLLLGERLGLLDDDATHMRRIGERLAGPAVADPAAHGIVLRMAAQPSGRDLLEGLCEHLTACVGDPALFAALAPLVRQQIIASTLERCALERRAVGLFLCLMGARVSAEPGKRIAALGEGLDALRAHGIELTPEHAENAFGAIWAGSLPSLEEARVLASPRFAMLLAGTSIPGQLVGTLAQGADLRRADPAREEVVNALAADPSLAGTQELRAVLEAFAVARAARGLQPDHGAVVRDALECASAVPETLRPAVWEIATASLVQVIDRPVYTQALVRGCRLGGAAFAAVYARSLRGDLDARRAARVRRLAGAYRCWGELEKHRGDPAAAAAAEYLTGKALAYLVEGWSQRELAAVTEALADSPNSRQRWTSWLEARRPSADLLDRILAIFTRRSQH